MPSGFFHRLAIGQEHIPSHSEYRRAILRSQLSIICMVVGVGYFLVDNFRGISVNYLFHVVVVLLGLFTFALNRAHRFFLASSIFIAVLNLVVFLYCSSESFKSGASVFYICCCLTAFALFSSVKYGLVSCALSVVFFSISFWSDFHPITVREFTEEYLRNNFAFNFFGALVTCVLIVNFLISVNRSSEKRVLVQNEMLVKANQELDQFVYSTSHDLRAPLSSILGLAQLYVITKDESEKKAIMDQVKERALRMDKFIAEILDYSRNTRSEIRVEPISIHHLVSEVVEGLNHMKGYKTESVEINIPETVIEECDPWRLKIVLNNLISNSIRYTRREVEAKIQVTYRREGSTWCLAVADNGTGIKAEYLPRIFRMFYRASENSDGSGLGLYIVKETLDKMGGRIEVKSEYDKGSVFTIYFEPGGR